MTRKPKSKVARLEARVKALEAEIRDLRSRPPVQVVTDSRPVIKFPRMVPPHWGEVTVQNFGGVTPSTMFKSSTTSGRKIG